jgi:hypothetical protein
MFGIPFYSAALDYCQNGHDFFGLVPWYHYLGSNVNSANNFNQATCNITSFNILPGGGQTSDIPLILLAVVDDLLRIGAIVALAFILYGAFQYTSSQGESETTARARGTIINALIGLAITMIAIVAVNFLGNQLGGTIPKLNPNATGIQPINLPQASTSTDTIKTILGILFAVIGALSVLMITISGLRYIFSAGDAQKVSKAKEGIIYAVVGVAVAISAEAILAFVVNRL